MPVKSKGYHSILLIVPKWPSQSKSSRKSYNHFLKEKYLFGQISNDDFLVASGFGLTYNTSDPYRGWHRPSHLVSLFYLFATPMPRLGIELTSALLHLFEGH